MSPEQVREHIATRPLTALQVRVIAIGVLINMIDGFDLLAASLISPIITREWGLSPSGLGLLFSSGLLGTAVGALVLSPVADLYGRRNAIVLNLALMSVGMFLSANAGSVPTLTALRFLTGMGVGAMASCVGTLIFEYASMRTRTVGLGLVTIGYNVGVVIGGVIASEWLIGAYGWRSVFVFGGVVSALLIPLVLLALPESIDFLIARPRGDSLARLNRVLRGLRLPAFDALPPPPVRAVKSSPIDLLRPPILSRLLLMQLAYFLYMLSSYFFLNWGNQLTTEAGFSDEQGRYVSILTNAGGIAGGILVGILALRLPFRPLATFVLLLMGACIAAFALVDTSYALTVVSAVAIGFGIFGAAVVLYATGATTFPARVRATGMGLSMSAGRLGAFLGPAVAGLMLESGSGRVWTCVLLAIPVAISAAVLARVPLKALPGET